MGIALQCFCVLPCQPITIVPSLPPSGSNTLDPAPSQSQRSLSSVPASPSARSFSRDGTPNNTKGSSSGGAAANKKKGKTSKESGSSSDEERWLEKIKDPKLMTARQRAMYDRENNTAETGFVPPELLVSLPTGYKEKVMTAEAIERAQVKSAKRKQLADQKAARDRQRTMDRLLKKQESKLCKVGNHKAKQRTGEPIITYKSTRDHQSLVTFPADYDLGVFTGKGMTVVDEKLCAMCDTPKRYNCSKTNTPLCSLRCYQENNARREGVIG